jgi:hypothetical protein
MRTAASTLFLVALVALVAIFGGASAFGSPAASKLAGGPVYVHLTPSASGGGPIVITGAIGDYGTSHNVDKNGKPKAKSNYAMILLKKGTFEVNTTILNAKQAKAQPNFNTATCSFTLSVSGPVTLFNGTGLYQGISGTANITVTFGFVGPVYTSGAHKGKCNTSNNAQPLAQYGSINGPGTVKFS